MPSRKMNGGVVPSIDEVFEIAEMTDLAKEWSDQPGFFETAQLERYRELCAKYGVDSALLLFSAQNRSRKTGEADQTRVLPQVGEVFEDA